MFLIGKVKLVEVAAPAPDTHNEVGVIFGVLLGIEQARAIDRIELKLMTAELYEGFDELCSFFDALVVAENGVVKLKCERTAVDYLRHIKFREREYYRQKSRSLDVERGRKA